MHVLFLSYKHSICHELQIDSNICCTKGQFRKYSEEVLCLAISLNKTDTSIFKMLSTLQQRMDAHALLPQQKRFVQLIRQTWCWKSENLCTSADLAYTKNINIHIYFKNQTQVFILHEACQQYIFLYLVCILRIICFHPICSKLTTLLLGFLFLIWPWNSL